ncbi:MAG: pantetheine-phosphate adenylyltransferase, partial [Micrococcales bacterium]|nr:pantetheine-phosphate adenylyltransferase [Micrococcales bacterium]
MTSLYEPANPAASAWQPTSPPPAAGALSIAVVPGSFDPVTLGHCDVILRTAALFDQVIVAVGTNQNKQPLFSLEQRVDLIKASLPNDRRLVVQATPGLLADLCRQVGAKAIVKGLRDGADWAHEEPMALVNRDQADIETIFLPASPG